VFSLNGSCVKTSNSFVVLLTFRLSQFFSLVGRICGVQPYFAEFCRFRKSSANPDISRKSGLASRIM